MSRIAKKPIIIPNGVNVSYEAGVFAVKGPLGSLSKNFRPEINIAIKDKEIEVTQGGKSVLAKALLGTYASHIKNMIKGVTEGFEKKLMIEGVGLRYNLVGDKVKLDLGFSHPVEKSIPAGLKVVIEKNLMSVSGIDKELVGEFSAKIRSLKKTEPYKGKGIRYVGEFVRRKQGKKASA